MTDDTFLGLECVDCGRRLDPTTDARRCPDCEGALEPRYDLEAVDADAATSSAPTSTMWAFEHLLPFDAEDAATLGEGNTPLVSCPSLAEELGVGRVLVKDEGHNPTGTVADRELAVAATAARERGASDVALASTGADGVAAAAYGARVGIDVRAFVPSRSSHTTKAMINVHGGDMSVVGGRYPDAVDACRSAVSEEDWAPIGAGDAPLRVAGAGTVLLEIVRDLDWTVPDAVVYPTGHGVGVVGGSLAAGQLVDLGVVDHVPPIYAAQASGCAPIVRAYDDGTVAVDPIEHPDTIAGELEVPDPGLGDRAVSALRASDGGAVAVEDDDLLASACTIAAAEGVQSSVAGGAAAAGAWELAQAETFDEDDTVVLVDTGAGSLDSDVLRSHLMGQGI